MLAVAAPIGAYLYWDDGDLFRTHDSEGELRRQFHIPEEIRIAKLHRTGRVENRCQGGGVITGEVTFQDEQFEAYRAGLNDRSIWRPTPLRHFSTELRDYHFEEGALEWRAFQPSRRQQTINRYLGYMDDGILRDSGPGYVLCYDIRVPKQNLAGTPEGAGYSGISVASCIVRGHVEGAKAFVLGHLDPKRRTLRMRIRLKNPPHYCKKARLRQFAE